ncbi:MAG: radical SAM protein [Nanoarchaeota archaeon]
MKTPYSSYCINQLPEGCKYCVKGKKLVLFISGKCSRNCWYCSLSNKRKNKDIIWTNERQTNNIRQLIQEAKESNATSAGITGGDLLLFLSRTIKYARALKKKFKKFHIHIYLPTKLVNKSNLKKLSKHIDEIRFHPEFLINNNEELINADINKIKLASLYYKKQNIGIELPMIPDKKQDILDFIIKISPHIGFVNLNEFELSETNYKPITTNYTLNQGGYTIKDSIKSGIWLLKQSKKQKIKLKVHLCTAELKNNHQFKNRLKLHNILPYGKKTGEGLVKYLVTYKKPKTKKGFFHDKQKKRYILSESLAKKILINKNSKIYLIEEFPTYDRIETEKERINISNV